MNEGGDSGWKPPCNRGSTIPPITPFFSLRPPLHPSSSLTYQSAAAAAAAANVDVSLPRSGHRRYNSDTVCGLRLVYPNKPIEMPVGVNTRQVTKGRHRRSVSMDSCFNGEGMFNESQWKKILGCDKLTQLAASNPKHLKRILANRESAARSKERKAQYVYELEDKLMTLHHEAATLSAQFTLVQREKMMLVNKNNELRIRLQRMEQHAQLCDSMIEELREEVKGLRMGTTCPKPSTSTSTTIPHTN